MSDDKKQEPEADAAERPETELSAGEPDESPDQPDPAESASAADSAEPDAAGESGPPAGAGTADEKASRTAGSVAWIALFIALVAAAATGYAIVQDWRSERSAATESRDLAAALDRLRERVAASENSLETLENRAGDLDSETDSLGNGIDRLESRFDDKLELLDSLPTRMRSLEDSMAALQGISAGARETWLIAEAEYYMQLANAQLQLARNPELALLALQMADERIRQLSDPGLIDVRRALADELAALEAMDKPDIEGATLTLASLARVVESLPVARAERAAEPGAVEPPEEESGIARFWASVKGAFSGLVKVTPPEQAEMPFLAPEAEGFLRTNLMLKLQVARLALLRGEQAVFEQSLDDARTWLREYFETGNTQVRSAIDTISEIRENIVTIDPPDISESLRLLRQYRTLAGNEP